MHKILHCCSHQSIWRDLYITVVHSCLFGLVYWWILFRNENESLFLFSCCKRLKTLLPISNFCLKIHINVVDKQIFPHFSMCGEKEERCLKWWWFITTRQINYPFDYLLICFCLINQTYNQTLTDRQILKTNWHKTPNETKRKLWNWWATFNESLIFD